MYVCTYALYRIRVHILLYLGLVDMCCSIRDMGQDTCCSHAEHAIGTCVDGTKPRQSELEQRACWNRDANDYVNIMVGSGRLGRDSCTKYIKETRLDSNVQYRVAPVSPSSRQAFKDLEKHSRCVLSIHLRGWATEARSTHKTRTAPKPSIVHRRLFEIRAGDISTLARHDSVQYADMDPRVWGNRRHRR